MYEIVTSNRFKKDLKVALKRGYKLDKLKTVIDCLASGQPLAEKYKDHVLTGNFEGFRECHISPDWILVYRIEEDDLLLYLLRTGTHSDLF